MHRNLYSSLLSWKTSPRRKPLLLRGARQTGKTYLLEDFGRREFEACITLNFEKDPALADFFSGDLQPDELVRNLSLYTGRKIRPEKDLLFFDEVQSSDRALNSLKYFHELAPEYHLAAAGSLLGIALSGPSAFPVGKVNFLDLYPMSFPEFLQAVGAAEYKELIQSREEMSPFPEPIHNELLQHLRTYFFTGGMPECVAYYASTGDLEAVRSIQNEILGAYVMDFAKYASAADIPKLRMIWDAIPAQLARPKKRFFLSNLKKSARLRDFENAIQWLEKAGLIHRVFRVKTARKPLKAYAEENIFKVYALDIGLVGAQTGMTPDLIVRGDRLFQEFEGALTESYVLQELIAEKGLELYYWESNGTAEVDFVCEYSSLIYPLEAKAGINVKSKSLQSFDSKFTPPYLGRTSLLNMKRDGRILNYPLYAISLFPVAAA